jgi:hypothetical protein
MQQNKHRDFAINWTYEQITRWRTPEPWDLNGITTLFELDTPDNLTTLLLMWADFDESAYHFTYYGIEAPQHCPMRKAFECGDITWDEFWTHQDRLVKLAFPFNPGAVQAEFIGLDQINLRTQHFFQKYNDQSPYEMKRYTLKARYETATNRGIDPIKAYQDYLEFMARHGDKLKKSAA